MRATDSNARTANTGNNAINKIVSTLIRIVINNTNPNPFYYLMDENGFVYLSKSNKFVYLNKSNINLLKQIMTNFETIIQHLGPSASPLMSFLNKSDANKLAVMNKYIADKVLAHTVRWGFKPAPYMEHADGRFTLTTSRGPYTFNHLKPHEHIGVRKSKGVRGRIYYNWTHEIVIVGNDYGDIRLVSVSIEEARAIYKEAKPYIEARRLKLRAEADAKALAEAKKAEAETKAKVLAEKTKFIKILHPFGPPPPTNPWTKK